MKPMACINGDFMPIEEAMIPIEDRGFQLGDGIYEVVILYGGDLFLLEPHLKRLEESAGYIDLDISYKREELAALCHQLVERSDIEEGQLYIQVTRGVLPRQHQIPSNIKATLVMTLRERPSVPPEIQVLTMEDIRWDRCEVKATHLLPNMLAKKKAKEAQCHEAVFTREGIVLEGASNNLFIVKGELVITPPLSRHILKGVTRGVALDICRKVGLPWAERSILLSELRTADEVFLTGSLFEIRPVSKVDGYMIGRGAKGRITERISAMYRSLTRGEISL